MGSSGAGVAVGAGVVVGVGVAVGAGVTIIVLLSCAVLPCAVAIAKYREEKGECKLENLTLVTTYKVRPQKESG